MPRVIKFRAWDRKEEKMLFMNQQYGREDQYMIVDDSWTRFWEALSRLQENSDVVLMQFTGLHDKNGKEIYEGDVVQVYHLPSNDPAHPEWDWIECFKYIVDMTDGDCYKYVGTPETRVVIGNIYENPNPMK